MEWCPHCQKYTEITEMEDDRIIKSCINCGQFISSVIKDKGDISVGVVVLDESSQILLVLNREEKEKVLPSGKKFSKLSKWGLPIGRAEPEKDKDEFDTAFRETEEETGLMVDIDRDPRLRIVEHREDHTKIIFIGYPVGGKLGPQSEEIIEARWFPIKALFIEDEDDQNFIDMHPTHRRRAQELLRLRRKLRSRSHSPGFQKEN